MSPSLPSARFRRAAEAERQRLRGQLRKLEDRLAEARKEILKLEDATAEIRARAHSIESLVADAAPPSDADEEKAPEAAAARAGTSPRLLSGRDIRLKAIEVLQQSGRADVPIHYKEWLRLMMAAGFAPAGKRADAVFLSQINRSPVIKGSTKAGVYQLDPQAILDLQRSLRELQRDLASSSDPGGSPAAGLRRQRELTREINRVSRALHEASESLGSAASGRLDRAA